MKFTYMVQLVYSNARKHQAALNIKCIRTYLLGPVLSLLT